MAAHFPAPGSKSFSNPHQLQNESTTPSVTEQVKRHWLFTLSSNTRRRCLWMTPVRATFKKRKGEMVLRMMGRRSGASLPKDAVTAGARLDSGAALGLHKHLEILWGLMDRLQTINLLGVGGRELHSCPQAAVQGWTAKWEEAPTFCQANFKYPSPCVTDSDQCKSWLHLLAAYQGAFLLTQQLALWIWIWEEGGSWILIALLQDHTSGRGATADPCLLPKPDRINIFCPQLRFLCRERGSSHLAECLGRVTAGHLAMTWFRQRPCRADRPPFHTERAKEQIERLCKATQAT